MNCVNGVHHHTLVPVNPIWHQNVQTVKMVQLNCYQSAITRCTHSITHRSQTLLIAADPRLHNNNTGPIVTFRSDNKVWDFRDLSVREIQPPLHTS